MHLSLSLKIYACSGLLIFLPLVSSAQDEKAITAESSPLSKEKTILSYGEINSDNINIRADSTVSSKITCIVNKGEPVEIIKEMYEWYKIRLPKSAPSFIKKNLVMLIDGKTAKVIKNNVNMRLEPNESSIILGKANENEIINIIEDAGDWYKIEPLNNSYGWVHKQFVTKVAKPEQETKEQNTTAKTQTPSMNDSIVIEGIIKPYGRVFKRIATHKLVTADKILLLIGNKESLDSLNYHKVRVTGKLADTKDKKYTTIEIRKIEAMD